MYSFLHIVFFYDLGGRSQFLRVKSKPPLPKQIITDFIYFKILSFTTLDVYWIALISCYISYLHFSAGAEICPTTRGPLPHWGIISIFRNIIKYTETDKDFTSICWTRYRPIWLPYYRTNRWQISFTHFYAKWELVEGGE